MDRLQTENLELKTDVDTLAQVVRQARQTHSLDVSPLISLIPLIALLVCVCVSVHFCVWACVFVCVCVCVCVHFCVCQTFSQSQGTVHSCIHFSELIFLLRAWDF